MAEHQLQLDSIPKRRGRPPTGRAKTGAQRAAKCRAKKRKQGKVTVALILQEVQNKRLRSLLESHSIDDIVDFAFKNMSKQELNKLDNQYEKPTISGQVTLSMDTKCIEKPSSQVKTKNQSEESEPLVTQTSLW